MTSFLVLIFLFLLRLVVRQKIEHAEELTQAEVIILSAKRYYKKGGCTKWLKANLDEYRFKMFLNEDERD